MPAKKGRQTAFQEIMDNCDKTPYFFYESVHRIEKFLAELVALDFTGTVYIARELSKMFEQKIMGTPSELLAKVKSGELVIKGEFVVGMWDESGSSKGKKIKNGKPEKIVKSWKSERKKRDEELAQ